MQNGLEKRPPNDEQKSPQEWGQTMRNMGFVLLATLISWLMSGVFLLKENEYAVVSKLGRFHSVRGAGVHWVMPFPFSQYNIVPFSEKGNVTVGSIRAPAGSGLNNHTLLSADAKPFKMQVQLQYRVPNIKHYLITQAVEVEPFLKHAAAAVMRQFAAQHTWDTLRVMPPEQLSKQLQTALQTQLNDLSMGIVISKVVANPNAIRPTEAVQKEYASLQAIEQQFADEKAKLQATDNLAKAQAEADALRVAAEKYKEKAVAQAQDNAAQFAAILPQYQQNAQAARTYLHNNAMQTIFENTNKVIVDGSVDNPVHVTVASASHTAPENQAKTPQATSMSKPQTTTSGQNSDTFMAVDDVHRSRTRDPDVLRQRVDVEGVPQQ